MKTRALALLMCGAASTWSQPLSRGSSLRRLYHKRRCPAMRRSVSVVWVFVVMAGCGHNSLEQAKQNLTEASKQCSSRVWPSAVAHVTCLDSLEEPVFERQLPVALGAFRTFSTKRRYAAQQADVINATGIAASAKYVAALQEAQAVLKAHEPNFADANSNLTKEWVAAKAPSVCKQAMLVEQVHCIGSILRPIWERNAPETLSYYDEHQKKHLEFARDFDVSGANETRRRAAEYFVPSMKQALAEFRENSQRAIQVAHQQDAAAREQALQTFGNILAGVAVVTLAVAEAKAAQQPAYVQQQTVYVQQPVYRPPIYCTSQPVFGTVHTDCQ